MQKVKAYSYIRMSTEIQVKGNSLQRQIELSEQYALTHNLDLISPEEYRDLGVSAFKSTNVHHGALGRFLDAVKTGKIAPGSVLLVESLDRLSRADPMTALTLFMQLLTAKIDIVTMMDGQRYSQEQKDSMQLIKSLLIMERAHDESMSKSVRISAAWQAKRERLGEGKPKLTKTCPHWLDLSDDRCSFLINPERAKIVNDIFANCINGLGVDLIAKRLNQRQVPCWGRTVGWRASYIMKLLSNRSVLGELALYKAVDGVKTLIQTCVDYYPSIVTPQLFLEAENARFNRRGAGGRKGKQIANLLSGVAICGYCGSPTHLKDGGPKNGKYLICDKGRRGLGCTSAGFPYKEVETTLLHKLPGLALAEIISDEKAKTEIQVAQSSLKNCNEKIASCEWKIQRFTDSILDSSDPPQSIAAKIRDLEIELIGFVQQRLQLQDELAALSVKTSNAQEHQQELRELVLKMNALRGDQRLMARAKAQSRIRSLVKSISLYPKGRSFINNSEKLKLFLAEHNETEHAEAILDHHKKTSGGKVYVISFASGNHMSVSGDLNCKDTVYIWDTSNFERSTLKIS